MDKMEELITDAESKVQVLQSAGVVFDQPSINHYPIWNAAISSFKSGVL